MRTVMNIEEKGYIILVLLQIDTYHHVCHYFFVVKNMNIVFCEYYH